MTQENPVADPQSFLRQLLDVAVRRASPADALASVLPEPPAGRTVVVGAGKAAGAMAHALDALWPASSRLTGIVVTRYGHTPPRPTNALQRIEVVEASHPVPDEAGQAAARRIIESVRGLEAQDLVICLISGGGSALLSLPADGLSFKEKQQINEALLLCGASIDEMNCVRKHLSAIKGGRLAAACSPARILTLAISDVPGDDISVIASGPTVPDLTTVADALRILDRYAIALPSALRARLASGDGETPKPGDPIFLGASQRLIATPRQALEAAARESRRLGIPAYILGDDLEGESREVARVHGATARSIAVHGTPFARPCVLLSGGETTVTIRPARDQRPKGRGGRAGEFCLGLAHSLKGHPGIWALAADTDGIDGVENNAGALVTPDTLERATRCGLSLEDHFDRNDSYGFFSAIGDLVVTGPTFTNVNDFRAVLIT